MLIPKYTLINTPSSQTRQFHGNGINFKHFINFETFEIMK